ncbi:23S rRNA (uracil(1939)-C(5))-methyltransferase RlmD [Candidatus Sumerlaeota bacterium]|nr:23S rRNA (uracil(1939)-C(5))-methyltransferase RlmD [Candidatus Sumerlaeota bacterium]
MSTTTEQAQERAPRPRKGEAVEVSFDALAFGGAAVGRREGFVVFTKYAAPGDRATVRVHRAKKNYGEGELVEVLHPAPERIAPVCPLFTKCGGCSWQHLPIETQRTWKERIVRDSLRAIPGYESIAVHPLIASPDTWRYRNKMEFTFARWPNGRLVAGFHRPDNWREILDVENCWLAPEPMERILRAAVEEGVRQNLTAWNPKSHEGTLRQLVIRHSVADDGFLALILTGDRAIDFNEFADALLRVEPRLKGVSWGLNAAQSDVARASDILESRGLTVLEEKLGDHTFRVSLASFFQTNSRGAVKLYEVAREALELTGRERLLDAYCGTGTIGIFCANAAKEVYGIELVQDAVHDARENAACNGLQNTMFMPGDMRVTLPAMMNSIEGRIDRLVVDPPRGGMERKALDQLLALRAPRIAYVSCNPTTMARDLVPAIEAGYTVEWITPVDMFPQTYHVECVAKLTLKQ